jgi:GNAT superfamily N-acetyltransferase
MKLNYQLVPYSEEIRDAYVELLPEQELEVARGKLEWKFRHSPAGSGMVAVARDGKRILGLNGFMSAPFTIEGAKGIGFQSMDTIVSPEARGQGVFSRLLNTFYDQADASLLYGFPNANSSPAFFGKLGWTRFAQVPMLFRPLRTGFLARRFARFLPDIRLPLTGRRFPDAREMKRFDESTTKAWRDFAAETRCAVDRDCDFLNWRLADHPTETYSILGADDGAFVASNVADKHGARIGYLMEAIGPDTVLPALIGEALHRIRDQGAELALAWCLPGAPNYRAYRKAGFYPFPTRLRPIMLNFGARPIKGDPAVITDPSSWYISYLDSDTA